MHITQIHVMLTQALKSPMPKLSIDSFGLTDKGLVRPKNEDHFGIYPYHQIYAVADGLGGLPRGALASTLAVESLESHLQLLSPNSIINFQTAFNEINEAVYAAGKDVGSDLGIGTTFTVVQVIHSTLHIGHVGDTGVFLFRDGFTQKLTIDHTMAQEILDGLKPDEAVPHIPEYFHHSLTRCLGQADAIQVDTHQQHLLPGDKILLYSDGVTKVISSDELESIASLANSAKSFVKDIIQLANKRGGPDNTTAIALFFQ